MIGASIITSIHEAAAFFQVRIWPSDYVYGAFVAVGEYHDIHALSDYVKEGSAPGWEVDYDWVKGGSGIIEYGKKVAAARFLPTPGSHSGKDQLE